MKLPDKRLIRRREIMGEKTPIDEYFLCEYGKTLSPKEIELIENLEALEENLKKQADLVAEMRMAIFYQMYKKRQEQEEKDASIRH